MTLDEAIGKYGLLSYEVSVGQTLTDVVRYLFGSEDQKYFYYLKKINHQLVWFNLKTSQIIQYLSKSIIDSLDEVVV